MRLAPPVRTTARNPVLDAALAQKRAADELSKRAAHEACIRLAVEAQRDAAPDDPLRLAPWNDEWRDWDDGEDFAEGEV